MVMETWVMTFLYVAMGSTADTSMLGNASILRTARLLRLSRLFRMARLVRMIPELLIMIKAIFAATRSVCFTLMLLGIVVYVFGIAMVQTLKGTDVGSEYFNSVMRAAHTLILHGTLLDDVSSIFMAIESESALGVLLMYIFVVIAAITIMNMLIGVLCEVI